MHDAPTGEVFALKKRPAASTTRLLLPYAGLAQGIAHAEPNFTAEEVAQNVAGLMAQIRPPN
jgi:hypothetical protein